MGGMKRITSYALWLFAHLFQSKRLIRLLHSYNSTLTTSIGVKRFCSPQEFHFNELSDETLKSLTNSSHPVVIRGICPDLINNTAIDHSFILKNFADLKEETRSYDDSIADKEIVKNLILKLSNRSTIASTNIANSENFWDKLQFEKWLPFQQILKAPILIKTAFISSPGFQTRLHLEPGKILNIQLHGRKKWFLLSHKFSHFIDPLLSQSSIHFSGKINNKDDLVNLLDQSVVVYSCELEKGDALFVPPFHWHLVETQSESVSISLQWSQIVKSFLNNPYMYIFTISSFLKKHFKKRFFNA